MPTAATFPRIQTKEEARASLQRSTEKVAQAQSALAEALHHGSESDQRTASAVIDAEERGYEVRRRRMKPQQEGRWMQRLKARGERAAAYARSEGP